VQNQHEKIDQQISAAEDVLPMLRCAAPGPTTESLLTIHQPPLMETVFQTPIILASDGSQINPSRHDAVEVGLVNLGLIRMVPGCGRAPDVVTRSRLLYPGMPDIQVDALTEELVAILRDVEERKFLSEMALAARKEYAELHDGEVFPVVAFTDGPLELFREPRGGEEQRKRFQHYLKALDSMAEIGAIPAGYVDKPRANLLVRMLEVMTISSQELERNAGISKYRGIDDTTLLLPWLTPGCRTTVFRLISRSAKTFAQESQRLSLHFFYINVGYVLGNEARRDVFARVEIPAWVAKDANQLDLLHHIILDQCMLLGTNPYPYVLHRAHEIAVVSFREKDELMRMIIAELMNHGLIVNENSMKIENKSASNSRGRI
jgi:hypothetical protein